MKTKKGVVSENGIPIKGQTEHKYHWSEQSLFRYKLMNRLGTNVTSKVFANEEYIEIILQIPRTEVLEYKQIRTQKT